MKKMKLRGKTTIVLIVLLVVSVALNVVWSDSTQREQAEAEMLEKARILSYEMDAVWEFMDMNQARIDTDSDGSYNFKGLYCAIAGKSIAKILERDTNYVIRYTNLEPRKKASMSDDYESEAIRLFNDGSAVEKYGIETYNGQEVFRYVTPIYLEESCLDCHGDPAGELDVTGYPKEGMEVGDLIGVTSIIMPIDIYMAGIQENVTRQVGYFSFIIVMVILAVYVLITRLITRPLSEVENAVGQIENGNFEVNLEGIKGNGEIKDLAVKFDIMAEQLRALYGNLEGQVELRTAQLESANELLEKQRSQLARVNEELQAENQYKSDFLAIMSHELRTPLTSIIAFTEIWQQANVDRSEDETAAVKEVKENGQLLLQMVNNILEMARVEAGRNELSVEPFDMMDLIGLVERSIGFLAEQRNISLATVVHQDVPIITADWEKIRRIVENLASNAIKFTRKGGSVSIEVSYHEETERLSIAVSDTGIGIKEEDLSLIFERFTQSDKSSYRRYGGSGLGLAVVKELVEMHGGAVEVRSVYKQGSTFTVWIPTGNDRR
ncbi:ATP-binding protein [Raoultibacter massiliensis]|uniref:ATP-binding protein n=1 Tax=Raoultibacter massiliensis TaxID=1852371 RepID=UPI000C853759|nr:ATP-binding protein [Raoultibacter massiliensis]